MSGVSNDEKEKNLDHQKKRQKTYHCDDDPDFVLILSHSEKNVNE